MLDVVGEHVSVAKVSQRPSVNENTICAIHISEEKIRQRAHKSAVVSAKLAGVNHKGPKLEKMD